MKNGITKTKFNHKKDLKEKDQEILLTKTLS